MKKILFLIVPLVLLLASCNPLPTYDLYNDVLVDGYEIYKYNTNKENCEAYFEDVYYSDLEDIYYLGYSGCDVNQTFFIEKDDEMIYLRDALELNIITIESLLPALSVRERYVPRQWSDGYFDIDFYIDGKLVLLSSMGDCRQMILEVLYSDETYDYVYSTYGCETETTLTILYFYLDDEYISVREYFDDGGFDIELLMPILVGIRIE